MHPKQCLRIRHRHLRPLIVQPIGHLQGGRIPNIITIGLKRCAQHRHLLALRLIAQQLQRPIHYPVPTVLINGIHMM